MKSKWAQDTAILRADSERWSSRLARKRTAHRENPAICMWYDAKRRAKLRGLPFSITKFDIVVPSICPVFLTPLIIGDIHGFDMSPSLDAIIPELGYIKGNVQVISRLANLMKNKASDGQLRLFAEWVLRDQPAPPEMLGREMQMMEAGHG